MLGLHTSAGDKTCNYDRPGSKGYEDRDAEDYEQWGITYLKYANCFNSRPPMETYQWMQQKLNLSTIFYGIANANLGGLDWLWGPRTGKSWTVTRPILDNSFY